MHEWSPAAWFLFGVAPKPCKPRAIRDGGLEHHLWPSRSSDSSYQLGVQQIWKEQATREEVQQPVEEKRKRYWGSYAGCLEASDEAGDAQPLARRLLTDSETRGAWRLNWRVRWLAVVR